jgi:hypothetical protein
VLYYPACSYVCECGLLDLLRVHDCERRSLAPDKLMCWRTFAYIGAFDGPHRQSGLLLHYDIAVCVCNIWMCVYSIYLVYFGVICRDTCGDVCTVSCVCLVYFNVFKLLSILSLHFLCLCALYTFDFLVRLIVFLCFFFASRAFSHLPFHLCRCAYVWRCSRHAPPHVWVLSFRFAGGT